VSRIADYRRGVSGLWSSAMRWSLLSSPLLSLLALLSGCASFGANYREIVIPTHTAGDIWREIEKFARSRNFPPDPAETDVGKRIYTSRWAGVSAAFRRGANRRRFFAQIVPVDEGWMIQFHVEVQRVDDFAKRMRPEEEDWEFGGQDRTKEEEFYRVMQIVFQLEETKPPEGVAETGRPRRGGG